MPGGNRYARDNRWCAMTKIICAIDVRPSVFSRPKPFGTHETRGSRQTCPAKFRKISRVADDIRARSPIQNVTSDLLSCSLRVIQLLEKTHSRPKHIISYESPHDHYYVKNTSRRNTTPAITFWEWKIYC